MSREKPTWVDRGIAFGDIPAPEHSWVDGHSWDPTLLMDSRPLALTQEEIDALPEAEEESKEPATKVIDIGNYIYQRSDDDIFGYYQDVGGEG